MGSSTNKTTTTSGVNNKALNETITKLAQGISSAYTPGASMYTAPSSTTTGGWQGSLDAAGNQDFSGGITGALTSYGNRAAGNELGINDPLYAAQRERLIGDVTGKVNNSFNNSGLFGSDSNVKGLTGQLTDSLGALDLAQRSESYGRQSEAANMLPQLFAAGQLPSSIQQSVGSSMDADKAAQESGIWDYLNRATGTISGAAGAAGSKSTTSTPTAPLWQTLLGIGLGAL